MKKTYMQLRNFIFECYYGTVKAHEYFYKEDKNSDITKTMEVKENVLYNLITDTHNWYEFDKWIKKNK